MTLHDTFEKVFILTLPGAEERRAVLEGHLREVGIVDLARVTWVRAVAGSVCPPPIWFRAGEGAWGCFCSHVRMAQDAAMDGVESYFVIEDDATFRADACERLGRVMAELPGDWGQLYLGGEHLREPVALPGRAAVMRAGNVNRTHAYAVHRRALARFQYHVTNAVDFATAKGGWHIDHQIGRAHERELWPAYCARRWLAGQRGGKSSITGRVNATLWWHPRSWAGRLPFVNVGEVANPAAVHCGNNLKPGTCEDIGLDACVESDEKLAKWLAMIAREASERELLPGWSHPGILRERVAGVWKAGVASALTGGWKKFREGTGIVLNWSPVPGATGYVIYRSSTPNPSFSWPTDFLTALLETTYFDKGNTDKNAKVKGLNSGSDYYYQVTAVNAAGISPATTVQVAAQYSTMKTILFSILLFAAFFRSLQSAEPVAVFAPGARILFQGDSITDGNRGRSADPNHILGHGYAFIIAAKNGAAFAAMNLDFMNRGVSGNTVLALQKRWAKDTIELKPDVLSILVGINDHSHDVPLDQYEQVYDALLAEAMTANPKLRLVLGEPFTLPVGKRKENYETWRAGVQARQDVVARLAAKYGAALVRFQPVFDAACKVAPAEHWIWDGVHPTYSGHHLMADEWERTVRAKWPSP